MASCKQPTVAFCKVCIFSAACPLFLPCLAGPTPFRAASSLQRLQVLLAELKLDAENQELQSSVDAVRAQYKQTYAQIGLGPARKAADKLNF